MAIEFHKPPFVLKSIKLEVTHECPLCCTHCSSEAGPTVGRSMSRDIALGLGKQIVSMGLREIDISGGEPLKWRWTADLIDVCASGGLEVTVYTSGYIDSFGDKIRKLKDCGLSRAIFSIFGKDAQTHERVTRRVGSFRKTLESVECARDADLGPEFHFVPLSNNYRQLPELIDLSVRLGVKTLSVLRFVPHGRGSLIGDLALDRAANIELRRMIRHGREFINVRAGSPFNFLLTNESPRCCAAIDRLIIVPDYYLYPCDAFKGISSKQLVGTEEFSRVDKWSLKDCWENSHYLKAIRDYLTSDFPAHCRTCRLLAKCLSGCLAQKVLVNGDLRKDIDPMCLTREQ